MRAGGKMGADSRTWTPDGPTVERLEEVLVAEHGAAQRERIRRGLRQVAARWRPSDGDARRFEAFVKENFISDEAALADTAAHLEYALEMLDGHTYEAAREIGRFQDLDEGPLRPVDGLLAGYDPASHHTEDLFAAGIAHVALLNFPLTTLDERLDAGRRWSRLEWALARLTGRFEHRLPADAQQAVARTFADAARFIDAYDVPMARLATAEGPVGFPADKVLSSHWGLRDEISALYGRTDGLERQRLIARVMERIIGAEVPEGFVGGDGDFLWDPMTNRVREPDETEWHEATPEAPTRYQRLLEVFAAQQEVDPYYPDAPTHIARSFSLEREIPADRARALLESVLLSPTAAKVGALVRRRLGRPLEPFDLWYSGFRALGGADEAALDALTRERYPTPTAFHDDIPRLLGKLGFSPETAAFLADHIVVDPARGAGHAAGSRLRSGSAHLRAPIARTGMNYKGFNTAVHELGHTVEQTFSMARIDHTLLEGVPNSAFTEAFAFLFQERDMTLLGQPSPEAGEQVHLQALDRFWSTYEIAGVGILDLEIWEWMYAHPDAGPVELREAVVRIARDLWNRYYAPVFGIRDALLPAIYSHIIVYRLYTPNYALGYLITSQIQAYVRSRNLATEMERMCRLGRLAPDVWMQQAVGSDVSSDALLGEAEAALTALAESGTGEPL